MASAYYQRLDQRELHGHRRLRC